MNLFERNLWLEKTCGHFLSFLSRCWRLRYIILWGGSTLKRETFQRYYSCSCCCWWCLHRKMLGSHGILDRRPTHRLLCAAPPHRSIERQRDRESFVTHSGRQRAGGRGGDAVHAVRGTSRQRPQSAQGLSRRPSSCHEGGLFRGGWT